MELQRVQRRAHQAPWPQVVRRCECESLRVASVTTCRLIRAVIPPPASRQLRQASNNKQSWQLVDGRMDGLRKNRSRMDWGSQATSNCVLFFFFH